MVRAGPTFGRWTLRKFNATIMDDILPEVVYFTLVAVVVAVVSSETKHSLAISNQMLTVFGLILGLVISFRTSTAYERYMEGRKLWANIAIASRNLAQIIWIHVPTQRKDTTVPPDVSIVRSTVEKKSMVNLVQAFSVSVKHFLRGEHGIYYEDLYPLICFLPKFATPAETDDDVLPLWRCYLDKSPMAPKFNELQPSPGATTSTLHPSGEEERKEEKKGEKKGEKKSWFWFSRQKPKLVEDPEKAIPPNCDRRLKPAMNPPPLTMYDYLPFLRIFKPIFYLFGFREQNRTMLGGKRKPELTDSNVPVEVTLYLSSYYAAITRRGYISPAISAAMWNNIASLQDTLENLERIKMTPLPFAYQAHLRVSLWIYLFFLPFQVYSAFHYLTIPATTFASFMLLGFLEIGHEIENPFNYDENDLNLDRFCSAIKRELHQITAHTCPEPEEYLFSDLNQPFVPADPRNAAEIVQRGDYTMFEDVPEIERGVPSLRRTLLKEWRETEGVKK